MSFIARFSAHQATLEPLSKSSRFAVSESIWWVFVLQVASEQAEDEGTGE